jgi:hypothetical protein
MYYTIIINLDQKKRRVMSNISTGCRTLIYIDFVDAKESIDISQTDVKNIFASALVM